LANRPFWEIILKIWPFQKTSIIKKGIPPKKIYSCNKAPRNPKHRQALTNNDRSTCELYLVTNDRELTEQATSATYKERWGVEVFHKSLKQEVGLEKSPTKNEVTQSNHVFAAMIAWTKMELLRIKEQSNHSALKTKLYVKALKAAYEELQVLKELPPKVLQTAALDVPLLG